MSMNRRSARGVFVLVLLAIVSLPLSAQNRARAAARKVERAARNAVRAIEGQNTVVPGCPGSGLELDEPTVLEVDQQTHALSTKFDVVMEKRSVPSYTQNGPNNTWICEMVEYDLRMYKDPKDGIAKYPGPTLHLRRESDDYKPGDRWSVLLQNHLPASQEDCSWAGPDGKGRGTCDCSTSPKPRCCGDTTPPNGMNCFHGDNTTNLHFHGTHVSPQSPQDYVLLQLSPFGQPKGNVMMGKEYEVTGEFQYAVNPLPDNQAEGTHWYHPHKHGSTAEQVGNGMAGAVIIEGPFDDWLRKYYRDRNRFLREKVIDVQNIHELNFTAPPAKRATPIPLLNGQLAPQITMYKGEVQRWRFINANIDADAQLVIDFNGVDGSSAVDPDARQIAMDGVQFSRRNYQCQPMLDATPCDGQISDLKFMFSPGNRADFLIKAPNAVGKFFVPYEIFGAIEEQGTAPVRDPRGGARSAVELAVSRARAALDAVAPGTAQPALLSINVIDCPLKDGCAMEYPAVEEYPDLPGFLRPITPNRPQQNVQFQILNTAGKPQPNPAPAGIFGIWVKGQNNDKQMQFDDTCANFTIPLDPDGGEEWHISQNGNRGPNSEGELLPFHIFHIHTNPFQVVSTFSLSGKKVTFPEPIWMDSITLPNNTNPTDPNNPSTEVVIRQRFEDYTGGYVLHCHFLGHEDRGMMLSVQTVCPNQPDSWSETSTTQKECTFGKFVKAWPPCKPKTTAESSHSH
jgi:FtsP/CotA-like multicopper oxidase with cupredoxin domain